MDVLQIFQVSATTIAMTQHNERTKHKEEKTNNKQQTTNNEQQQQQPLENRETMCQTTFFQSSQPPH